MTQRTHLKLIIYAVMACVFLGGCIGVSENNPSGGNIDMTNGTDVRIAVMVTFVDQPLQDHFDRAPYITRTNEPGQTWNFFLDTVDWTNEEATEYCTNKKFWFVTPRDPDFIPTGAIDRDRTWTADDVIVISTLETPCFDEYDEYLIEAN